jgi:hypothetical protein
MLRGNRKHTYLPRMLCSKESRTTGDKLDIKKDDSSWIKDSLSIMNANCKTSLQQVSIRYGVVANISRSHNLRDQYRGAQGSIPCTGVLLLSIDASFCRPSMSLLSLLVFSMDCNVYYGCMQEASQ